MSEIVTHLVEEDGSTPICGAEDNWAEVQKLTHGVAMCRPCLDQLSKDISNETGMEISIDPA